MHDLLNGVRVLDLTTILLGPYATRFLGDLGADVIKVEPPGGDLMRYADTSRSEGMGAAFLNCNRNKRSIVIDLARPDGLRSLQRLIGTADVFVHNMRPKSAKKLGIAYDDVRAIREDVVYCYACGFGQGGRMADEPAYDDIMQAVSGLAFINAQADGEPRYVPNVLCDKVTGLHLAIAILAGVISRNRSGAGICIETPMLESMVSFLFVEMLGGRTFDPPLGETGYHRLSSPFRRPFRTRDGYVGILPYSTGQWQRFLGLVGRHDLVDDACITNPVERSRSIDTLYRIIAEAAPERTTGDWIRLLRDNDIPCANVQRAEDVVNDPHLRDVEFFESFEHETEGRLVNMRTALSVTGAGAAAEDRGAPGLGNDSADILRGAGFADAEIAALVDSGAVQLAKT